jgi:Ca2+-binding RTX toxin-like protein
MKAPPAVSTASLIATLNSGFAWPAGPITFSIPTAASLWPGYAAGGEPFRPGYAPPPTEMAPQIRLAMQRWDELIAPALLEVTEPGAQGQLRVAFAHLGEESGAWGYAYYPTSGSSAVAGDVWIDPSHRGESFAPETYNFQALLHELGHALGLKHPFEAPNILAAEYDTQRHTLMSYTQAQDRFVPSFTVTQTSPTSSSIRASYNPVVIAGPQLLDVLAIQAIYGADPTTRAGDTTYSFDPAIASIQTIYDAGGTDTWDLSASTRRSLIDLREGAFSSVNQFSVAAQIEASLAQVGESWRGFVTSVYSDSRIYTWDDNVSIAYGTIIENLRLGSAGDHAIGNAARNALSGHDGNDTLLGEGGNDSLEGGGGDDNLVGGAGDDTIAGGSGNDVAAFTGARAQYSVSRHAGTGILTVRDNTTNRDGTDLLQADVETLRFSDGDHLASSFPAAVTVLSIAALSADKPEGSSGATPFTFTVTRTGDLTGVSSAHWAVTGNGATASDFPGGVLPTGTVSFVGGQTNTTITVSVAGDSFNEVNEGFTVTLSAPTGATLGMASATGTIRNDDTLGITGTAGPDTLTGTAAAEPILGLGDHDSLDGGGGDDTLTGGAGDDRLTGGLGLDRFEVDAGSDTIADLGLDGADVLVISAGATASVTLAAAWTATAASANNGTANLSTAGFSLDLGLATGSAGWSASNLGSNRAVTLTGSLRNDRLTGGLANDTLVGGAGHDSLAGEAGQDSLLGGEGTDTLAGGAGHDRLLGEAGNDSLTGGAGNDTVTGGAGVDRFVVDAGTDTLLDLGFGGNDVLIVSAGATAHATLAGAWTASGNASNAGVVNITAGGFGVNLAAAAGLAPGLWTVTNAGHATAVSFTGSLLRDRLTGGLGADSLVGGLGDDTLTGGDGADTLHGGAGVDSLVGGAGDDRLTGGAGVDRFLVEAGTDTLTDLAFGGNDVLVVQAGAAAVVTMGGHWTPSAGSSNAGSASLAVAGYNVNLASVGGASGWALSNAHARAVNLVGSSQGDTITGGIGEDKLRGHGGADSLVGGAGNDQIWGGAGDDTMTGGAGIDRFSVDFGTDVITDLGAGGADVVIVSAGATLQGTLAANWTATTATINGGVATLIAAGFDVILDPAHGVSGWNVSNAGNPNGVRLAGSFLSDTLTGGDGDDTLWGTQNNNGGAEFLDGGAGADWLFASYSSFQLIGGDLNGGEGADTLVGGSGNDTMTGGAGIDRFQVAFGTDVITDLGAGGADVVIVRPGHTLQATLAADWTATSASINGAVASLTASGFDVNLQAAQGVSGWNVSNAGDANAVRLTGSVGNDRLVGGEGADVLRGITGLDTLEGGGGADTLDGQGGDRLTGGAGADVFVFTSPEGVDGCVITDFNAAEGDRLDLRALDADPELAGRQLDFIGSDPFGEIIFAGAPTGVNRSGAMRFENGWLQFDVNADGVADRQMQLLGVTTLTAAEMWL